MEASNIKEMREALESTEELLEHFAKPGSILADAFALHMRDNRAALAAPPRNCDVGSSEEQKERFKLFCRATKSCPECPVYHEQLIGAQVTGTREDCILLWAQMPYEPPATQKGDKP